MTTQLGTTAPAGQRPVAPPSGAATTRRVRGGPGWLPTVTAATAVLLATLGLAPLLDGSWLGWPLAVLVAVALTGGLLARTRAPLFLIPLAQTIVGLVVMVAAFVPDAPWGFLPTPHALATLQLMLRDGLDAAQVYVAPVPIQPGLLALVTLGVGICAMCTHVLAVSLRLPVLAGIPLVAMYAVPAAVLPEGAPWWAFVLISAGWVAMLLADAHQQAGAWGPVVGPPGDPGHLHPGRWSWPGIQLAVPAVLVALVVPPLVPGLADAVLGGRGSSNVATDPAADPDSVALDPFVSLRRDLQLGRDIELFTYRTTSSSPGYLRTVIADGFDGEKWVPRSYAADQTPVVREAVVSPPSLGPDVARTSSRYEFRSSRLASPYLPLPYPVSAVDVDDAWHWDTDTGVAFSVDTTTDDATWSADALEPRPTMEQLEAVQVNRQDARDRVNREIIDRIPQSLVERAQQLAEGRPSAYEQALAIQWWLRTEFTYSIDVKGDPTGDQLEQFLRDRVGYCQQFAATMALMARVLGISSRVAVGFTPGTQDGNGVWHVSSQDAHAWPELLFPGIGWVRFEPTPRASSDGGEVAVPAWAGEQDLATLEERRQAETEPTPTASAAEDEPTDPATTAAADEPIGDRARRAAVLPLLAAVGLAFAAPALLRSRRRRQRLAGSGPELAEGGWAELRDTVHDVRGAWSDAETPRQTARRLRGEYWTDEPATAAIDRLAQRVERARYARPGPGSDGTDVAGDLRAVRAAALDGLDRLPRWWARLFPRSVFRRR